MSGENNKNDNKKKLYEKPIIKSEEIFARTTTCFGGKCCMGGAAGEPWYVEACDSIQRYS